MPNITTSDFTLSFDDSPYEFKLQGDIVVVTRGDVDVEIEFSDDNVTIGVFNDGETLHGSTVITSEEQESNETETSYDHEEPIEPTSSNDLEQLVKNAEFERMVTQVAKEEPVKTTEEGRDAEAAPKSDLQDLIDKQKSQITANILEKLNNKN